MTKPRTPDTFSAAMAKINVVLGVDDAAEIATRVTGRTTLYSGRTMYEWANPEGTGAASIPLSLALAFDAAYTLAGGEGSPFRDAFCQELGVAIDQQDACRRELVADQIDFIREAAQLSAALISAAQPGASQLAHQRALVEAQDVDGVLRRIRRRLPKFLRPAMTDGPGNTGV